MSEKPQLLPFRPSSPHSHFHGQSGIPYASGERQAARSEAILAMST
jgi:hypothetical protein